MTMHTLCMIDDTVLNDGSLHRVFRKITRQKDKAENCNRFFCLCHFLLFSFNFIESMRYHYFHCFSVNFSFFIIFQFFCFRWLCFWRIMLKTVFFCSLAIQLARIRWPFKLINAHRNWSHFDIFALELKFARMRTKRINAKEDANGLRSLPLWLLLCKWTLDKVAKHRHDDTLHRIEGAKERDYSNTIENTNELNQAKNLFTPFLIDFSCIFLRRSFSSFVPWNRFFSSLRLLLWHLSHRHACRCLSVVVSLSFGRFDSIASFGGLVVFTFVNLKINVH